MNIKQAKEIPLEAVLTALQAEETKAKPDRSEIWYKSPWRDEDTASLKIDTRKNVWFDHGEGIGGDAVKLVCRHGNKTIKEALQWLERFSLADLPKMKTQAPRVKKTATASKVEPGNRLLKEKTITNPVLCKYISDRGLPVDLVRNYCREVSFKNEAGRVMFGIGMQNDAKGWEVRSAAGSFKTVVGNRALTSIADKTGELKTLHVFEGFTDFLTMENQRPRTNEEAVLILNSAAMASQGIEKIKGSARLKSVEKILCWFDNDETGRKILHQFAEELHELAEVGDMSPNYEGYKDLNEYWTKSPDARKAKPGAALKVFNDTSWSQVSKPRTITPG